MKVDLTPDEMKMLIDVYDAQMYAIDRINDGTNTNPVVAKKKSRLSELKAIYDGYLVEMRHLLHTKGIDGLHYFCKRHEDMTMDDAIELLSELKYRGKDCFTYER